MRQKIKKEWLKYAVLDNQTNKITIYRFKKHVADAINVSVKTLDRNINYKTDRYLVYIIANVVSTRQ